MKNIFSAEFVSVVREYLDTNCANGKTVTQTALCAGIDLNAKYKPVLGMFIPLGLLPGYKVNLGPHGGFVREDATTEGHIHTGNAMLTDEFIIKLRETLNKYVPMDGIARITRERIAIAMGLPGSKTENAISVALKKNLCPGFATKVAGPWGGIYRTAAVVESSTTTANDEVVESSDVVASFEDAGEVVMNHTESVDASVQVNDEPVTEVKAKKRSSRKAKDTTISDLLGAD